MLLDVSPDAQQIVLMGTGPDAAQDLLDAGRTETALTATAPPSFLDVIGRYIEAGIAHIFLGYDHIAFLAAVVLWARRLWPVVKIVTAFTIAHSITLSLTALDITRIPSAIIEPAIAATIVYVAAENFLSRDVEKRWRDAFGFGLIHGFGFASGLQEFGLPRNALVPALASFNIGVEIGQILIVSLVVPALLAMDRLLASDRGLVAPPTRPASAVYGISAAIIGLGSYWFLARTLLAA
jgi:hydrogenase/urease accessory protein HupE